MNPIYAYEPLTGVDHALGSTSIIRRRPLTDSEKLTLPMFLARQSVTIILGLLCKKVPLEIALYILKVAKIHPGSILTARESEQYEIYSLYSGKKTYLTARIPFYDNPRGLRNFKPSAAAIDPDKRIIDRLIFRIRTRHKTSIIDGQQVWKGIAFVEVELWRRKYPGYKDDIQANLLKQRKEALERGEEDPELSYHIKSQSTEVWNKQFHDYYHGYSKGGTTEETKGPNGKFKVGTWMLLQKMQYCYNYASDFYTVTWDWREDKLDEDTIRDLARFRDQHVGVWRYYLNGSNGPPEHSKPKPSGPWYTMDEQVANGAFIRELREGDEIAVVMRALKDGHTQCSIYSCSIECWWAL
ncbi:hypothetical protein TWF730_006423 [Orbilia blumenaviensis]|uniref:Uncharacterized protein n=1 Tax=Orbilia blumenaviensis TaxID=1796055 RepID=A0AAV9VE93_9PEZI